MNENMVNKSCNGRNVMNALVRGMNFAMQIKATAQILSRDGKIPANACASG